MAIGQGTQVFHVWIAKGPTAASDDFRGDDLADAKRQAAETYKDVPVENLAGHLASQCQSRGCNG